MAGQTNVREIVIVGGTLAGWMTAAVLARSLPAARYRIRLLESAEPVEEIETLAGGLASLPALRTVHGLIGLAEADVLRQAKAGLSLGAEFVGWPRRGGGYFRSFGALGAALDGVAFHNLWQRMRQAGSAGELEDYALGAVAARLGRFALPSADPASVLSTLDYGYHLDGAAYRDLLRTVALRIGATRVEDELAQVHLRGEDGFIESLSLTGGERLEADFFIDCTGAKAALIGGALETPFEDWSRWLPCDRAIAAREEGDPLPCLRVEAEAAGWQWRMPLGDGVGRLRVYASAHEAGGDAGALSFTSGRRAKFWNRNCVAIGASSSFVDPLEPIALQTVQRGIAQFLALMPFKHDEAGEADEYNRIMIETVERMRDLVILHYKANKRDEPFWAECWEMQPPEILADKMRLFESKSKIQELDEEMFSTTDWASVYFGQGIQPRAYDVLADAPDKALVRDRLAGMRKAIRAAAEAMPPYADFLKAAAS